MSEGSEGFPFTVEELIESHVGIGMSRSEAEEMFVSVARVAAEITISGTGGIAVMADSLAILSLHTEDLRVRVEKYLMRDWEEHRVRLAGLLSEEELQARDAAYQEMLNTYSRRRAELASCRED